MGLFSRKKKTDPATEEAASTPVEGEGAAAAADAPAEPEAPTEQTPEVGISFSAFRGVGAPSGPEIAPRGHVVPLDEGVLVLVWCAGRR